MDGNKLESVYKENLEEGIMLYLTETEDISYEESMEIYYGSKLAEKIQERREGIQYLDYKVLADILKETEQELFR
ncbi:hypothetical protein [Sporofaciens sp. JLR.KK001]|jgi:hypothetical protein|uniref:hypothetical protein n=1 Tax=Sporofaciens sp. JLR.KK001 TaxID=3112621 RepID=UPI002FF40CD7